jgi:nitric oxide reductase NorQ protein
MKILTTTPEQFTISEQPYYLPLEKEVELFTAAWKMQIPLLLKGPTGCGKTRFISYMAHQLQLPLITVSCHEDLTASDLIGRYLLQGDETVWSDGPMAAAIRMGAILYLDEVVEARKDTIVAIHPLTDHRRSLSIDKLASVIKAPDTFMLVVSYNPGYQSILKEMKPSTRQRFASIQFSYPQLQSEIEIVMKETGVSKDIANRLAKIAIKIRNLTDRGLQEGASTRLLVYAGRLIAAGIDPIDACNATFAQILSDEPDLQMTIQQLTSDFFL